MTSPIRIMIIDDDQFALKLLERMLATLGFAPVVTCESGHAAFEWIDNSGSHPDLILLDLNMPEMDGVVLLRHLVERRYRGSLILVSGEDEWLLQTAGNLADAHQIRLLGSLRKPVKPQELAALIAKWSPPSQNYAPRMADEVYRADELRVAIANDELVNYYQPKVAVETGRLVGMETLVRWHHPVDGMVLPDQFVGVAESCGLIHGLTQKVLTDALAEAKLWRETGLVLQLAVNVSVYNLASLDFADSVAGLAIKAGVPPQQVVLEVIENRIIMHDLNATLETLARLRLQRFRLSMDNVGKAHATLECNIPFDELKIDRSAVHLASTDQMIRAKYDAGLSTARQLSMEAVALGVENREDWDLLCRTGCDFAQGYFIAKPMPAADLPAWIQAWQARVR